MFFFTLLRRSVFYAPNNHQASPFHRELDRDVLASSIAGTVLHCFYFYLMFDKPIPHYTHQYREGVEGSFFLAETNARTFVPGHVRFWVLQHVYLGTPFETYWHYRWPRLAFGMARFAKRCLAPNSTPLPEARCGQMVVWCPSLLTFVQNGSSPRNPNGRIFREN